MKGRWEKPHASWQSENAGVGHTRREIVALRPALGMSVGGLLSLSGLQISQLQKGVKITPLPSAML